LYQVHNAAIPLRIALYHTETTASSTATISRACLDHLTKSLMIIHYPRNNWSKKIISAAPCSNRVAFSTIRQTSPSHGLVL